MKPVIEVRNLSKTYFMDSIEVRALQNVSFQIYPYEFVAVMGPSGSGKSSLLNILGCLDIPTSGQYLLNGQEVSQLNENQLEPVRNQKIG
ncbi:MAG: ATP-binding cassette domain-containing protein, partial [Atribacterota bacterium]